MSQVQASHGQAKKALLLDFGGVCLLSPVELHRHTERVLGIAPDTLTWMGPVDPSTDPLWRALLAEEISERDYWHGRAAEIGQLCGRQPFSLRDFLDAIFSAIPEEIFIRPAAVAAVARARAAGLKVGVLTNDLEVFHGPTWVQSLSFLRGMDSLVDASKTGVLKPDPRAYEQSLADLGARAHEVLFVDDQPRNVAGARALGIETVAFDIARPDESWRQVERVLFSSASAEAGAP